MTRSGRSRSSILVHQRLRCRSSMTETTMWPPLLPSASTHTTGPDSIPWRLCSEADGGIMVRDSRVRVGSHAPTWFFVTVSHAADSAPSSCCPAESGPLGPAWTAMISRKRSLRPKRLVSTDRDRESSQVQSAKASFAACSTTSMMRTPPAWKAFSSCPKTRPSSDARDPANKDLADAIAASFSPLPA